jgi:hypothetical protein
MGRQLHAAGPGNRRPTEPRLDDLDPFVIGSPGQIEFQQLVEIDPAGAYLVNINEHTGIL